jgi:hypothetical protein
MSGNQKTIAVDIIAQVQAATWEIPYTIAYRRMYIDALEKLPAAGTPDSKLKITIAPIEYNSERTGWGAARVTASLGIVCEIMVADPTNDDEIDPLEQFVESLSTFFVGARKFATVWSAATPKAIFGDDYIGELYESSRFFVPIMIDFFADGSVS